MRYLDVKVNLRHNAAVRDAVDAILEQWRTERPEVEIDPVAVVGRVRRLELLLSRQVRAGLADHDLADWEFDVLATLRRSGPPFVLAVGRLQATMMVSSGTMTHRLDRLERRGLLTRAPDPADRRGVLVQLTEAGRELVDQVLVAHLANERALLAGLSRAEQASLAELLRKLLLHLGDRAPDQR